MPSFNFGNYVPKLEHSDWTGRKTQCGCHEGWAMDDMDIIMLAGGGAPCGGKQPNLNLNPKPSFP